MAALVGRAQHRMARGLVRDIAELMPGSHCGPSRCCLLGADGAGRGVIQAAAGCAGPKHLCVGESQQYPRRKNWRRCLSDQGPISAAGFVPGSEESVGSESSNATVRQPGREGSRIYPRRLIRPRPYPVLIDMMYPPGARPPFKPLVRRAVCSALYGMGWDAWSSRRGKPFCMAWRAA